VLKVSEDLLTKSRIAEALGTNPMRVTRFIDRNKINAVKKEGKRELYKLTDFNALKEELNSPEANKEAKSHGFSKDDYILTLKKQLEEQKLQYEQVLKSKDETISSLKETITTSQKSYNDMKDQLAVKDEQIFSLTKLTNNAQTLNLVDKDPKRIQAAHSDAETKPEQSSSSEETDDSTKKPPKKHWWQFGK
jgi:predicted phage tail protein